MLPAESVPVQRPDAEAQDYAAKVEQLGSALLAAFEKCDAEYLASLRGSRARRC